MDNNNWRVAQGQMAQGPPQGGQVGSGEVLAVSNAAPPANMDTGDWRTQLQSDSRHRIVNKIMETLKRHLPFSGQEGLQELKKIAVRFEEKIYAAATSQSDYLRKISLKMLTMETKSQNSMANSLQANAANTSQNPADPALHSMQSQIQNQPLPMPVVSSQSQPRQQLLPQNMQTNIAAAGVQNSSILTSTLPSAGNLVQAPMPNVIGQNSNLQNLQSIPDVSQNPIGNSMGQGMPSNVFPNSQRQIQARQQQVGPSQQQQSQNPQHYLYQHQLQQQIMKQKLQQGGITQSLMQSHIQQQQQQQQQNLLQPTQIQTSQQAVMQPSAMQSVPLPSLQQNQQSSSVQQVTQPVLQQQSQSVLRQQQQQQQQQQPQQASMLHQQQTSMVQQPLLPAAQQLQQQQQQQQLIGQQPNATSIQHNQLIGQQNSISDVQQQQQRLMGQQNNISNLQHQQQQLAGQQNSLPNVHQPQLAPQSSVSGIHQQSVLGTQPVNCALPTSQHSVVMLQQSKVPVQQQMQQNATTLLPSQNQQPQPQSSQQQMVAQIQSQPGALQHLQQQSNTLQRDMQQRLQTPGSLLQQQNVVELQKHLFPSQRANPEASSTSLDSTAQTGNASGGDWQEEVYQKIKSMKDMYFLELNEMYMKIAGKLQQHDSLPQQPRNEQLEKLKFFKLMLDRLIGFLRSTKNDIQPSHKEKFGSYEKQIINILNSNRPRRPVSFQQGQLPQQQMASMQHSQPQSQISLLQPQENQMNQQMQPMNVQSSITTMQPNSLTSLQHNSMSSVPPVSNSQQNMMSNLQHASTLDPGQSNAHPLQQVAISSLQQNTVGGPQTVNVNSLSSQSGMTALQSNLNSALQPNSSMIQNQHLKQEPQMLQTQQLKQQFHTRQMQQQLLQRQQLNQQQQQHLQQQQQQQQQQPQQQQQQHQQMKPQQQPAQLPGHQMSPLHQMTDSGDLKVRQQMGVKSGVFQQHHANGQRVSYHHQQLKSGNPFPISSPQVHQSASPQVPLHASPQIDQQCMLASITKTATPLQSANSPFVVPSPSTPLAPSPMPGDSEKLNSSISSLSNAGNIGHSHAATVSAAVQSLAIGTPGISASPLLECTMDGAHVNMSTAMPCKPHVVEQPHERLIKAVKSISNKALVASVGDISSVVSMIDRIAGSAPGNGSRAAVGEDLVAMTKCRLQARNFFTQDGPTGTKKMRRSTSAMPSNVVSSAGSVNDNVRQLNSSDTFELESTATSSIRRPRIEANHALVEEIHEINRRLIDTVVDISDEDVDPTAVAAAAEGGEGTIVKCSFTAVALSPNLKSQYASARLSPIQPLRLLIPTNYPNSSPILLDKFPVEVSKEYEDLSIKAKSKFSIYLRSLSQPMSLAEMARTWDICARAVISEFAQQSGGGTFSSKYGTWENCLSAA
ncbi:hypothetical protein ACH5RR_023298 [Cinchona calisaya]|uniref:Mediator complex subunit 15 KIX domain-containing protein n=1 Tax=Cinchona calisaya TaxID=153742 RepID=A0ABD2ZA92_9GENT